MNHNAHVKQLTVYTMKLISDIKIVVYNVLELFCRHLVESATHALTVVRH